MSKERVTKSPAERKQELIDAAARLFNENGYEQTAVADIVRDVDVAQGTFYYYFSSKEEILEAVIEKDMTHLEERARGIIEEKNQDAAEKLNSIVNSIIGISASRKEIMDFLHQESNAVMHEKMERHMIERLVPLLAEVIEEGNAKKLFDCEHPTESVELLLASTVYFFHHPEIFTDEVRWSRMQRAFEVILERTLGAREYRFVLSIY